MYKSRLQELCHQKSWSLPTYTSSKDGPDHCPTFNATVSVNGIDFHAPNSAKSSKDAQNEAAKIAFHHFTTPHPLPPSPLPGSSTGIVDSSNTANGTSTSEMTNQEKLANSDVHRSELNSSGMQYVHKNQLQVLMQKKNSSPPVYGSIREGQPHAPRFKATVTVDGRTFESPDFFATLREAEHAAAKIALASLSDGIQEASSFVDAGVYKNLLQELSQKEGFSLPVYNTVTSGPSHIPTFVCTVEIEGETFSGKPAKSKKQAEIFAAKVAWCHLEELCETQAAVEKVSISPSAHSESLENHRPIISSSATQTIKSLNANGGIMGDILPQVQSTVSLGADGGITDEIQQDVSAGIKPSNNRPSTSTSQLMFPLKTQIEAVPKTEELSSVQDPLPTKTFSLNAWSAAADLSSSTKSSSSRGVTGRIQVYPRGVKIQPPEGAIWLPISDNDWVAAQLRFAESQS
ncbi:HLA class II histocompatibility antigen, DR beta 4 chain [Asimina triloba]